MKLSQAIRLGAMLRPQAFNEYRSRHGSCAMGAAAEACGVLADSDAAMSTLEKEFDAATPQTACPSVDCYPIKRDITNLVVHLNDVHHWTRECIADWVETIEAAQEQKTAPLIEAVTR